MEVHSTVFNQLNLFYKKIMSKQYVGEPLKAYVSNFLDEIDTVILNFNSGTSNFISKKELDQVYKMFKSLNANPYIELSQKAEILRAKDRLVDAFNSSKGITQ